MRRSAALFVVAALALAARAEDLRLELTRQSLLGTHYRYRQYVGGQPVLGGEVNISPDVTRRTLGSGAAAASAAGPRVRSMQIVPINIDGTIHFARRVVRSERPLEPVAHYYDVVTGALLYREPLYFTAHGLVFDPNPVVTLNDPSLRDQNDAASAVPPQAYRDADVDPNLTSPYVQIVDLAPPLIPRAPAGTYDRQQDGFEDVNAFFHIARNQNYLQSLGYRIVSYAVPVDTHAANGTDNSFFLPSASQAGRGTLYFGEGGTDDAEDADLVIHEYGHAILEWIAPGTFAGPFASQSRAIAEGFGDYWAFSAHHAQRVASGRDPFCFADWDARCWTDDASEQCGYPAGSDCLRRLDSTKTLANYEGGDVSGVEHRNGQIWSSALRELHLVIGRSATDTIVIESLFGAPPHPTFAAMAQRMLEVDRLLYRGAHASAICAVMSVRGILTTCSATPRGELTYFPSTDREVAIPENDPFGIVSRLTVSDAGTIERVAVRVDIIHSARGDLRITLVAPDGTEVLLQNVSFERTADIHTTYGIDVAPAESLDVLRGRSADGVWQLRVADQRALDAGRLVSWSLVLYDDPSRPEGPRQVIPVVGHVIGAVARYQSELRLSNPSSERQEVALIFTPSGADGTNTFAEANVSLAPGQTAAFDDVVQTLFQTTGTGSLQILGDVLATSRAYATTASGTLGQQVPANLQTTSRNAPPLWSAALGARANLGITETEGHAGTVIVKHAGGSETTHDILPFSHIQFPLPANDVVSIRVAGGDAHVVAYVSNIENGGDQWFLAAEVVPAERHRVEGPVIRHAGFETDFWLLSAAATEEPVFLFYPGSDAIGVLDPPPAHAVRTAEVTSGGVTALGVELPGNVMAISRIVHNGTSQGVPFRSLDDRTEQHLPYVESSPRYRTNIGIASDEDIVAEVIVYDAAGVERERLTLTTVFGFAQVTVTAPVSAGRALVRFAGGRGLAWSSVVDSGTGDASFFN